MPAKTIDLEVALQQSLKILFDKKKSPDLYSLQMLHYLKRGFSIVWLYNGLLAIYNNLKRVELTWNFAWILVELLIWELYQR